MRYLPVYDIDESHYGLNLWFDFNDDVVNLTDLTTFLNIAMQSNNNSIQKRLLAEAVELNYTV
jgi:hypothetical protein